MREILGYFKSLSCGFEKKLLSLFLVALGQAGSEVILLMLLLALLQIFFTFDASPDEGLPDSISIIKPLEYLGISDNSEVMALFVVFICITCLFRLIFIFLHNYLVAELSQHISKNILATILNSKYVDVLNYPSHILISSVTKKVDVGVGLFLIPFVLIVNNTIVLFAITTSLLIIDLYTNLGIFLAIGLLYVLSILIFHKRVSAEGEIITKEAERMVGFVDNAFKGLREIFLYNSRKDVLEEFAGLVKKYHGSLALVQVLAAVPRPIIEAAGLLIISVAGLLLMQSHDNNLLAVIPLLGAIVFGLQRMLPLAQQVYSNITVIKGATPIAKDLSDLASDFESKFDRHDSEIPNLNWDSSILELKSVEFSFESNATLLKNISVRIEPEHQFVAITGASGVGKSTFADLLMGLLSADSGHVMVNGIALTDENRKSWMLRVAHVPQVTHVFPITLAENIAFQAVDMNLMRVNECIALVGLLPLVESLTKGVETRVGSGGRKLSGGQKQRLSLARALYRNFNLLVLDEAFNGIDHESVSDILVNLKSFLKPSQKVILISHIPKHFETADLVINMDSQGVSSVKSNVN